MTKKQGRAARAGVGHARLPAGGERGQSDGGALLQPAGQAIRPGDGCQVARADRCGLGGLLSRRRARVVAHSALVGLTLGTSNGQRRAECARRRDPLIAGRWMYRSSAQAEGDKEMRPGPAMFGTRRGSTH
eukprot:853678-Prorocentrum_minimum.AAC.5